ncbi:MAG: sialidase family protein, partial [Verrucomicrobia bacterium]|nr:sialidase family protein [Verrucomicrobiota bacterium]
PDTKLSVNEGAATLNENMGQCIVAQGDALHVVWCDTKNNGSAIYYKRSLDGGLTWGADTRLSGNPGSDSFPLLAQSASNLHLVFFRNSTASYYKRSTDGGSTWGPDVFLGNTKWWPGVAAGGSNVYVSLNTVPDGTNSEVFFRRSTDNGTTWQPQQQISHAAGRSEDPAIVASGKHVHLVWNDNRDGNMTVYYRHSPDMGVTWGSETALTHAPDYTYFPTIYLAGPNVDIAYGDRQSGHFEIYHLHSADFGSTWPPKEQMTQTSTNQFYPAIVRDGPNVHLLWTGSGIKYLHSGNGGGTWDPVVSLVSLGSTPFVAVAGEAVHVIFLSQRDGHGAIYYKRNPTGNPPAPRLTASGLIQGPPPGHLALSWNSAAGQVFSIESTTSLLAGFAAVVQSNILATPPTNTFTVPVTNDRCFYRLKF